MLMMMMMKHIRATNAILAMDPCGRCNFLTNSHVVFRK